MKLTNLITNSDDNRAVSPVIGVILMVAITVILAAVIGTFVLGLGSNIDTTPQASFDFESNGQEVTVTHRGGDTLDADDIDVRASNGSPSQFSGTVGVGDQTTVSSISPGDEINIVYTGGDGESIIASYTR